MKIMLSAGEVSGDVHGAYLVRELKKLNPDIYFFGMGSERLSAEGVDIKYDITSRGSIGLLEALPNAFPIYLTYKKMIELMRKERPNLLILIDSQGFNLPLAKEAKKLGIRTVYYIAPQDWLWGTPAGVKKVAATAGLIVAIFEKEYDSYKKAGANVIYFGHPLIDIVKTDVAKKQRSAPLVAICPGSRPQEIKGLLSILVKASVLIKKSLPDVEFIFPAASSKIANSLKDLGINIFTGKTYDILSSSDLAICTSGTINLEASILGIPNIMVYKISAVTYLIGKYVLKILDKLPYFSMPNILLGEKIIPELIMKDASPEIIAKTALSILGARSKQEEMKNSFARLREKLGAPGVISKIAGSILQFASARD